MAVSRLTELEKTKFLEHISNWKPTDELIQESKDLESRSNGRKIVLKFNLDGELVDVYNSVTEAGEENDLSDGIIGKACRTNKVINGFIFKYEDDDGAEEN